MKFAGKSIYFNIFNYFIDINDYNLNQFYINSIIQLINTVIIQLINTAIIVF